MAAFLSSAIRGRWLAALCLALCPALIAADNTAASYYVRDLPGVPKDSPPIKMHAGHIEVTPEHNGNLFFWHFQNRHIANKQRTVIWLNGGPGCSSEDGALMEIGPYRVKDENTLTLNEGSWHEFANLLFVDNPVGTGFSFVDTDSYIHELDVMAENFITFLTKFFEIFPEYERDDIYIAGESYAGQYIPYIARAILDTNKNRGANAWNLRGLLIGNGWISPKEQYESYIPFALEKGLFNKGSNEHNQLLKDARICNGKQDSSPGAIDYPDCEKILSHMLSLTNSGNGDDSCYNMYDVRLKDSYPSCGMNWPKDLKAVVPYLRRKDVVAALNVNSQKNTGWQECTGAVGSNFNARKSHPTVEMLPGLLKEIPILLFSGGEDLICNHIGTENFIANMQWNDGKGFEVTPGNWAPRRTWTFEGENAGFWQEARNLTYVLFHNSSHMVPVDYPRRSRDMLDRFMEVDISSIGGQPADSRIDGEKGPETSVGGVSNDTSAADDEKQKQLDQAKWDAYYNSGGVMLVLVIIVVSVWGFFLWRSRRRAAAYKPVNQDSSLGGLGRTRGAGDLEAAAFDESELDDLHADTPTAARHGKYSVGDDSDEETEKSKSNGRNAGRVLT
ncbi:Pheromone-processing carboxypeptidase KEX1 [Paramyrothecium foliicola]|nr:Pheromone-processing carboxypeptidase KEX1 [Paramyrothecium foliicola]